ncbi:MAG: prolyl oligopeptidase family serine peptidase [Planctomycetaceae bacterium]
MPFAASPTRSILGVFAILCLAPAAWGQTYKQLPPPGIELPEATLDQLRQDTQALRGSLDRAVMGAADADAWRADVEVFVRAVELAIDQNLFYKPKDAEAASRALQIGRDRLEAATRGKRGLELLAIGSGGKDQGRTLAGGYISTIDASVQPYGLVLPSKSLTSDKSYRMDVWLHGRGDTTTEVPFLIDRLDKIGQYSPADVVVLHPFGRHCNAFKFAGETDVYEALEHVRSLLTIDPKRISIRGFSMGGAGVWHLAAHDPGRWFAANPGAGFVDTIQYQGWTEKFPYDPGHWGRPLMNWYDVIPWVDNLSNTKVVAYSGEVDKQRASAELMIAAAKASPVLREQGFEIEHIIGKDMGHKIDAPSAAAIDERLAQIAASADQTRTKIHFVTHTLRYHTVDWLSILGMQEHWTPATIDASIADPATVRVTTDRVTSFRLDFSAGGWPLKSGYLNVVIDGQTLDGPAVIHGKPSVTEWVKDGSQWKEADDEPASLRKRPGLQGPIDDAFTSSFLFVLPSRPCRHGVVQRFVDREVDFARENWRRVMRGADRVVMDKDLTSEQIANCNLICFGDFNSNRYLSSIASQLPIQWTDEKIVVGEQTFDPATHAALLVYPNPQAPNRYVVVNSGITFRQFANSTNSRQIAMLPDWAVLNVTDPSDGIYPGRVDAAGFFDESWKIKSKPAR